MIRPVVGGGGWTYLKPIEGLSTKDTKSHQGHKIAEAFGYRLWLKEVHLSSGLFVFIGVHSWFIFINDGPFFLE